MTALARSTLYVAPALLAIVVAGYGGVPAAVPAVALAAAVLGAVALLLARVLATTHDPPGAASEARAIGYVVLGLGLAAAVLTVTIPAAGDRAFASAALPIVAGFPLADALSGRRGAGTLCALILPLVAGVAIAATAAHLPYGLSTHPDARASLLRLACGVLLAGAYALLLVLAASGRLAAAALLSVWPMVLPAVVVAGYLSGWLVAPAPRPASLAQWSDALLPATVAALVAVHVVGLVTAAHALLDREAAR